ncbi:MAG: hypothetical protein IPK85_11300 [Gemmatimonadetes bacterium]|nr:hypothetical protein [Gemmatimonadota bacterium]
MKALLASLASFSLLGCLAFVAPDDPGSTRDLVAARARWNLHGATAYTMRGSAQCFCILGGREVEIDVAGGRVTRVRLVDTGADIPSEFVASYRSVEELFDLVDEAIRSGAHRLEVTYDAQRGFPTQLWIDWSDRIADEEYGFRATALTNR